MCIAARPKPLEESSKMLAVEHAERLKAVAVRPLELNVVLIASSQEGSIAGLRMVYAVKETGLGGAGHVLGPAITVGAGAQRLDEVGELIVSERGGHVVDDRAGCSWVDSLNSQRQGLEQVLPAGAIPERCHQACRV